MFPLVKRFLPLIILLVAVSGFLLLRLTRPEPPPAGDQERRWPVAVIAAQSVALAPELRLYGQLNSATDAVLRARVAADVVAIPVRAGQSVQPGDLLVQLDDLDARALLAQREAELADAQAQLLQVEQQQARDQQALIEEQVMLEIAERQYQRITQLARTDQASARQREEAELTLAQQRLAVLNRQLSLDTFELRLTQARAGADRAQRLYEMAERDWASTRLQATGHWRIQSLEVSEGDRVAAHEPLMRVFAPQALEMQARIPLPYVSLLDQALNAGQVLLAETEVQGQNLTFRLNQLAARTLDSAGLQAGFVLDSGDGQRLALGQFVDALLTLPEEADVFWLPAESLQGRDRIYRVVDGRLEGLNVQWVGEKRLAGRPGILIRSDELASGDQVLANRLPNAITSLSVEVVEELELPVEPGAAP